MGKIKKIIGNLLLIILVVNMLPSINIRAEINDEKIEVIDSIDSKMADINIISNTIITADDAKLWAKKRGATQTFINLADLFWKYSKDRGGVNPAVAYVQSAKETGYGKFGGVIDETYFNTCGLKVTQGGSDVDPNAHHRFNNWDEGVQAHLDHLALYAAADGYPRSDTFDPRHEGWMKGRSTTVKGLGTKWAPSDQYGIQVLDLYYSLSQESSSTVNLVPRTNIDEVTINDNKLYVRGWATNKLGVDNVNVYLDGNLLGAAKYGQDRVDVDNIYPGYPSGTQSGYDATFDISNIPVGNKTLKVEQVDGSGKRSEVSKSIEIKRLLPKMDINTPENNKVIKDNNVNISGWALNGSGIKDVKVYLDNKFQANANIGLPRPDVNNIYPGYVNGNNSGFELNMDISDVQAGKKNIRVDSTGNDGTVQSVERSIVVEKIIKKPAKMDVDSPSDKELIKNNSLTVSGWALNDFGIKEVNVYVDSQNVGKAVTGISRPDVNSVYPGYLNGDKSGFKLTVNTSSIGSGTKKILVEAIGLDNVTTRMERTIVIQESVKKQPRMDVDTPTDGDIIRNDSLNIKGWALNDSGVKEVKVYVDDNYVGKTSTNLNRPDVNATYPGYVNGEKSGYELKVDTKKIPNGKRKVVVEAIGFDNISTRMERIIDIQGVSDKPARMDVDSPSYNEEIKNNSLYVKGWALNNSGVKEVNVYVDGTKIGNATLGLQRPDVNNAYPGYLNGEKSGYELKVDVKNIPTGSKKITVEAIGVDNIATRIEKTVIISRKSPQMDINEPTGNSKVVNGIVNLRGWALNDSGIKEVKVYIDGKYMSNATYGLTRPDVNNAFPGYAGGEKSGYELKLNLNSVSNGIKKIMVEAIGFDGTSTKSERSILVEKPTELPLIMDVDKPIDNEVIIKDKLVVKGWALNGSGIKEVKVFIDGKYRNNATYGLDRQDVANVYPAYANASKSGYELTLDVSDVPSGSRTVDINVVGNDNSVKTISKIIKVQSRENKPSKIDINNPIDNSINLTTNLNVRGWTLNDSGVKEVKVYINNIFVKNATIGFDRPDVDSIFPGYVDGDKSGYEANIDISKLSEGKHTIKIVAIGYDNTSIESIKSFKNTDKKVIVVDAGHNYGGDQGAFATHNGSTYSETDINMVIADKLRNELTLKGYTVLMTREVGDYGSDDLRESLRKRVDLANNANADLFISIHQNKFSDSSVYGTEVYYSDATPGTRGAILDNGIELTTSRGLVRATDKVNKSITLAQNVVNGISSRFGTKNRGVKNEDFYVVKNTNMPSILVECGFISNLPEVSKLTTDMWQNEIARTIADAVKQQF